MPARKSRPTQPGVAADDGGLDLAVEARGRDVAQLRAHVDVARAQERERLTALTAAEQSARSAADLALKQYSA